MHTQRVNKHEGIILAPLREIGARDRWLWAILFGVIALGG